MPSYGRRTTNDPILMWDVENKLSYNVYYAGDGRPADSKLHPRNCCLIPPERPSKRSHEQTEHQASTETSTAPPPTQLPPD
jgi:hypothetical protein